jgi:hypothetical protein
LVVVGNSEVGIVVDKVVEGGIVEEGTVVEDKVVEVGTVVVDIVVEGIAEEGIVVEDKVVEVGIVEVDIVEVVEEDIVGVDIAEVVEVGTFGELAIEVVVGRKLVVEQLAGVVPSSVEHQRKFPTEVLLEHQCSFLVLSFPST